MNIHFCQKNKAERINQKHGKKRDKNILLER